MILDLAAIKAACEAATAEVWQSGIGGDCNLVSFDGDDIVPVAHVLRPSNLAFIALARQALPECVAEIERLQRVLERMKGERDALFDESMKWHHEERPVRTENRILRDENARLRSGGEQLPPGRARITKVLP